MSLQSYFSPNTYLWEVTHPMIFQELNHSPLSEAQHVYFKMRLMHLLLNTSYQMIGFKCLNIIHIKTISKIKPSVYLLK